VFLRENILNPLQMNETGFHTGQDNKSRIAQPFAADPWTGDKVALYDPLEIAKMESGGGGLVSTAMDYARFCQMLLNGGTLDGNRVIGRTTLAFMASNHLASNVKVESHLLLRVMDSASVSRCARMKAWRLTPVRSGNSSGAASRVRSSGSTRRKTCLRSS
jgi:CubicO group peptidase (beta-lactamase class C family)